MVRPPARMTPLNVWDYERLAEAKLEAGAHGYYAGGADDELTLRDNVAAFRRLHLRPRMLVDVEACTTANDGARSGDRAAGRSSRRSRSSGSRTRTARLRWRAPRAPRARSCACRRSRRRRLRRWPRSAGRAGSSSTSCATTSVTHDLIAQARDCGFSALVLTVDAPVRGNRERDLRTGFAIPADLRVASLGRGDLTPREVFEQISPSVTWHDLERIAGEAGLPLLVKGVLTAEDARLACEHGAAGIVVSNHGGRQLDGVAATIDVLPEVVEAVDGRVEVLVDGGIRRGTDVVKALALGARAVLAGRAPLWGLAVDGEAGARDVLRILQAETLNALQLTGCVSPAAVGRDRVAPLP